VRLNYRVWTTAKAQEIRIESELSGRGSVPDLPEVDATRIKAHPPIFVQANTFRGAFLTLESLGLCFKVPFFEGHRRERILGRPPALFGQIQFLKADLHSVFLANLFKPDIGNTEPVHNVVPMWKLSVENLVLAPYNCGQ
jgi:hypothetical protein